MKILISKFKGYYSIIIRPKQIRTTIQNCGVLIDNQDVKGISFNMSNLPPAG